MEEFQMNQDAKLIMASGCSHSYGFYSEDLFIRHTVVFGASSFFAFNLK